MNDQERRYKSQFMPTYFISNNTNPDTDHLIEAAYQFAITWQPEVRKWK